MEKFIWPELLSVGKRFAIIFFPTAIVILLLFFLLYRTEAKTERALIERDQQQFVRHIAGIIHRELKAVTSDLSYLAEQSNLKALLEEPSPRQYRRIAQDYLTFAKEKRLYDQIRFIDSNGHERIRINFNQGDPYIVAEDQLQTKGDRYYFQQAMELARGRIYQSPFDLNVENSRIESPFKPVIRFATPVFDSASQKRGILVLNFIGERLLSELRKAGQSATGAPWLLNSDGYWLLGPKPEAEWGFMLPGRRGWSFSADFPQAWEIIRQKHEGQFSLKEALFTYRHFYPLTGLKPIQPDLKDEKIPSSTVIEGDTPWIIVSHLSAGVLAEKRAQLASRLFWPFGGLLMLALMAGYTAWRLATSNLYRKLAERDVKESKALLTAFLDHSPALFFIKDTAGKYLLINKTYEALFHIDRESIQGQTDFAIFPADIAKTLRAHDKKAIETGAPLVFDETIPQEDGEHVYISTRFPLRKEDGSIYAIGGIVTDITERKGIEHALRESEEKLRGLLETAPDGIVIVDQRGHMVLVNSQAERLFGYSREELLGQPVEMLVPAPLRANHTAQRSRYQRAPVARLMSTNLDLQGQKKDGNLFPLEVELSPLKTNGDMLTISIIRDISERKRMETHLRRSQKLEAIGQLTGGIAHDFNNLLGIIIGNLDFTERLVAHDESARKRVQTALNAALRGAELTKKLLAFSRKQPLAPQLTDVNGLITEMLSMLRHTLGTHITITTHLAKELPLTVIDPNEFENMLLNLAINARDAMPSGGELTITTQSRYLSEEEIKWGTEEAVPGDYIHISVTDNGTGIPPEVLERIFEPFFTTKERGKGTGLGLAMAYGFVKQSHGHIKVYSEAGHGTSFHIYFPRMKPTDSIALTPADAAMEEMLSGNETVLVVDDEPELLEIAQRYLHELGYRVLSANDAASALKILHEKSAIDVLLTDIIMPGGMNGIDLVARARLLRPELKVLFSSGFPEEALATQESFQIRSKLLHKPYRKAELARRLRQILDTQPTDPQ